MSLSAPSRMAASVARGSDGWDHETDVLVIGGGLAGHCAALESRAAGARTLLIEKQDRVGGSTVLSGGAMAFAGTDEQADAAVADTDELLFSDLVEIGEHVNDERLVRTYVEQQRETYRWLKARGVTFQSVQLGGGQSVPRSNRVDPQQMIGALAEAAERSGIRTRTATPALRLVRSVDRGEVTGAVLRGAGGAEQSIRARRGVVLTSGGFSRSEELLATFAPGQRRALRIGGPGNTGDGLRMACMLGAGLRDMGYVRGTFGSHPSAGTEQHILIHAIYKGAIAVNRDGRRFVDESLNYKTIGDACLRQPGGIAFQIFDQGVMDQSIAGVVTSDLAAGAAAGRMPGAASLAELAATIEVDAATLAETVARYNRDVDAGLDRDFGRDGLANHYGRMRRIEKAPFYAYPSTSAVLATYAGLAVDAAMRVRDVFGDVIEGLHAAGEIIGGFHGAAYMTGSSLGKSAIFGRVAGRTAASRLDAEGAAPRAA